MGRNTCPAFAQHYRMKHVTLHAPTPTHSDRKDDSTDAIASCGDDHDSHPAEEATAESKSYDYSAAAAVLRHPRAIDADLVFIALLNTLLHHAVEIKHVLFLGHASDRLKSGTFYVTGRMTLPTNNDAARRQQPNLACTLETRCESMDPSKDLWSYSKRHT